MLKRFVKRLWHNEDGAETVEFVGTLPLVVITIAIIWQFSLLGYTAVVAAGAAREGARAAAVGANCRGAAAQASPGWDGGTRTVSCSRSGEMVTAEVRLEVLRAPIPLIGTLPSYPWVTSRASMRYEPPFH